MVKGDTATWKANYFTKLTNFVKEFPRVMVVGIQNVRSSQLQQIRIALRGHAELLMGKNTMMRKAIRLLEEEQPDLQKLLPFIELNIGLCFTKEDPAVIRDMLTKNTISAPAKLGAVAPKDVFIQGGPTTMGPEKTSFFQALNIPTKIAKGCIEIINDVHILKEGDKVGPSEAALLQMLDMRPFDYGLVVLQIYDGGAVYSSKVLNIKSSEVVSRFLGAVSQVAAVSLAIGYPTAASVPHSIANGFKNVLAVAIAADIDVKQAEKIKAYLADPSAFAAAAAPAAAAPAAAKKAPEPEPEEEEAAMDFDLFG